MMLSCVSSFSSWSHFWFAAVGIATLLSPRCCRAAVVEYEWTIAPRRSVPPYSPDCFTNRDMLLINDSNPGPVIRASVGDTLRVIIHNMSPTEALSMHYHGISSFGQPYADGTQTSSQCNIGPLQTQINEIKLYKRDAGLHYYHGHTSLDRLDGLQGAIIIEDPESEDEIALRQEYDEERIIVIQDWYHRSGPSNRVGLESEPFIWVGNAQSFLINGKGVFADCLNDTLALTDCDAECSLESYLSSVDVEAGKTYLLRILNIASLGAINFAITNHTMTVVSTEGTFIEPRLTVRSLDVGVAQRYSVLLEANQPVDSYWMQTIVRLRTGGINGLAYLSYSNSSIPENSTMDLPVHPAFDDVSSWAAFDAALNTKNPDQYNASEVLSAEVDQSMILVGTQVRRPDTNHLKWAVNNISQSFPAVPVVYSAVEASKVVGAKAWPETEVRAFIDVPLLSAVTWNYTENVTDEGVSIFNEATGVAVIRLVKDQIIEVVLQNTRALNGVAELHNWHTHGHAFWIVGQGEGNYDPETDPESFNLVNPIRRDTLSLLPLGWTAIRFKADNPGSWPFHCVMTPHAVMGMGVTFVTSPELLPPPPPGVTNCFQLSLNPLDAEICVSDTPSPPGTTRNPSSQSAVPPTAAPTKTPASSVSSTVLSNVFVVAMVLSTLVPILIW